ncbi:unnamed protein product [Symbiodinium microadriaticum]|nr:unnamed protein product [Symbiodinium microadriaticum]CAE7325263.1 DEGP1 [Symbiodinium sp. KB8]
MRGGRTGRRDHRRRILTPLSRAEGLLLQEDFSETSSRALFYLRRALKSGEKVELTGYVDTEEYLESFGIPEPTLQHIFRLVSEVRASESASQPAESASSSAPPAAVPQEPRSNSPIERTSEPTSHRIPPTPPLAPRTRAKVPSTASPSGPASSVLPESQSLPVPRRIAVALDFHGVLDKDVQRSRDLLSRLERYQHTRSDLEIDVFCLSYPGTSREQSTRRFLADYLDSLRVVFTQKRKGPYGKAAYLASQDYTASCLIDDGEDIIDEVNRYRHLKGLLLWHSQPLIGEDLFAWLNSL